MTKIYDANGNYVGKDCYFILCRLFSGTTKAEKAIKDLVANLSYYSMEATELHKFEEWLRNSVETIREGLAKSWEIKVESRPDGRDGNGMCCYEFYIYRLRSGCPEQICYIYLYKSNLQLDFSEKGGKQ